MPSINPIRRPWMRSAPKQEDTRNDKHDKFYDSPAWRKTRKWQLQTFPLCKHCEKEGVVKEAKVADHIKPRTQGGADLAPENLQSLCERCHQKKSNSERKALKK